MIFYNSEVNIIGNVSFEGNHAKANSGAKERDPPLAIRGARTKFTALSVYIFTSPMDLITAPPRRSKANLDSLRAFFNSSLFAFSGV